MYASHALLHPSYFFFTQEPVTPGWFNTALYSLGGAHIAMSFLVVVEWLINNWWRKGSLGFWYHVLMLLLSVLGIFYDGFPYCFHLLHIAVVSNSIKEALQSITRPARKLALVTVFFVFVVYIFSVVGFAFFRQHFDSSDGLFCGSLSQCFVTSVTYGLRSGGGLGEVSLGLGLGNTIAGSGGETIQTQKSRSIPCSSL